MQALIVLLVVIIVLVLAAYLVAGAVIAVVYVGQAVLIGLEFLAYGFVPLGIAGPIAGWVAMGLLCGAAIGLIQGLKRAGRKSSLLTVYSGSAVVVLILLSSSVLTGPPKDLPGLTGGTTSRTSPVTPPPPKVTAPAPAGTPPTRTNVTTPPGITKVTMCEGQFGNNGTTCLPDPSHRFLGVRFEYQGIVPGQTPVRVDWYGSGRLIGRRDVQVRFPVGSEWHNHQHQAELAPGEYDAVLYVAGVERGRGRTIVGSRRTPPPAVESTAEHIRKARALLEARDYRNALNEAEKAVQIDGNNQEARALRDQIQGIMRILNP